MGAEIYNLIEDWAGRKTLFDPHPSDRKRFHLAIHRLSKTRGLKVEEEDFRGALRKHVDKHSPGSSLEDHIIKYASEAMLIFEFLQNVEECA
jgi:hypothetical protein